MKAKLNNTLLRQLQKNPPDKDISIGDDTLPGFFVKQTPNNRIVFYVFARVANGKPRKVTLGPWPQVQPDDARRRAQGVLGAMKSGVDPKVQREQKAAERAIQEARAMTLGELLELYLTRRDLKASTAHSYRMYVETYLGDWMDVKIVDITKKMVVDRFHEIPEMVRRDFKSRYTNKGQPTATRTMRTLSALLEWAVHEEVVDGVALLAANPVVILSKKRMFTRSAARDVIIPVHQCHRFVQTVYEEAKHQVMADFVVAMLLTGMRKNEVGRMQIKHVDLEQRIVWFPDTKTTPFVQPMSSYLYDILKRRTQGQQLDREAGVRSTHSDWVFPSPLFVRSWGTHCADPRHLIAKVGARIGIDVVPHDFRRTFISIGGWLNIQEYNIQALVNHKPHGTTQRHYLVPQQDRLRQYVQRIARTIMEDREELTNFRTEDWERLQQAWERSDWFSLRELEVGTADTT